jgi:hypothetical protein
MKKRILALAAIAMLGAYVAVMLNASIASGQTGADFWMHCIGSPLSCTEAQPPTTTTTVTGPTTTEITTTTVTVTETTPTQPPPPPPAPPPPPVNDCSVVISSPSSISAAANVLAPGGKLCAHAGTYEQRPAISVNGTSSSPIIIKGFPGDTKPIIRPADTQSCTTACENLKITGDFVKVERFVVADHFCGTQRPLPSTPDNTLPQCQTMGVWFTSAANGSGIYDSEVYGGTAGSGVFTEGTNLEIFRNSIHNNIDRNDYNGDQAHGVYIQGATNKIVNNVIYDNNDTGGRNGASSTDGGWCAQFFPANGGSGHLFAGNTCVDNGNPNGTAGCVVQLQQNVRITNNVCAHNGGGIEGSGASGCVVSRNLFTSDGSSPANCTYTNNITVANVPFVDRAGNNFRLADGSQAIDAADPLYSFSPAFDGTTRVGAPDIGAYER